MHIFFPTSTSAAQPPPPQPTPHPHRHQLSLRTKVAVERIRESFAGRAARFICGGFLALLFTAGVILFILWLALRPHRPRFYVSSFSSSPSLSFSLSIRNPNQNIQIYYYTMDADVYDDEDRLVGTARLLDEPIVQLAKNTTVVLGVAVQSNDGGGVVVVGGGGVGGPAAYRIEVRSKFRFRVAVWDTHKHVMHASCKVEVGPDGQMLPGVGDKRCHMYFT